MYGKYELPSETGTVAVLSTRTSGQSWISTGQENHWPPTLRFLNTAERNAAACNVGGGGGGLSGNPVRIYCQQQTIGVVMGEHSERPRSNL